MIYRIAIKDNGKFVRYASKKELRSLRVNSQGIVEMLDIQVKFIANYGRSDSVNIGYSISDDMWVDVSDAHEVEWGFKHGEISCYHNDILESLVSLSSYDPKCTKYILEYDENTASFWIYSSNDTDIQVSVLCPGIDKMLLVIGNINENPELMEEK